MNNSVESDMDFKSLVGEIITGGEGSIGKNFFAQIKNVLTKELTSNNKAIVQVIILAIISAFFTNFSSAFHNPQISQTGFFVSCVAIAAILMAIFAVSADIAKTAISSVVEFMQALIPIYFTSVAFSSGSLTTLAYYEIILGVIMVVNLIFLHVVISGGYIYVMISAADCVAKEESLTRLANLVKMILGWIMKTSVAAVLGLNAIQSLISPMADSMKSNLLTKALGVIPGVGNVAKAVSSTVIGAGTLVKNGIGVAALVVLIGICIIPVIKLVIFVITYKFISAVVQPVADKRIVNCINSISEGMKILLMSVLYSAMMFLVTIAIICISTNVNYFAS